MRQHAYAVGFPETNRNAADEGEARETSGRNPNMTRGTDASAGLRRGIQTDLSAQGITVERIDVLKVSEDTG